MKELTDEQIKGVFRANGWVHSSIAMKQARAAIAADRALNGITGEAQPANKITPHLPGVCCMTTTNEHTERAELIRELKELAEALPFEGGRYMDYAAKLVVKAAALLEADAQRPALKPLTDRQIQDAVRDAHIAFCLDKYATFEVALIRKTETAHGIKEQA